ncbi:MAG: Sulfur carrier protein CysO [Planctomycetes bacterium]|nr:Sulfur carrier protein CysO [Planctomycetota bacterium]
MTNLIRIPTPLRNLTGNAAEVNVEARTVGEALDALEAAHKGIKARICDEQGNVRRFVNVFLNDEDIRFMDNLATPLKDGDHLSIVPAIAGGLAPFPRVNRA